MDNIIGLVISVVFIFAIMGMSAILMKHGGLSNEGSRKFIHIGVSHWWIIAMIFFDNIFYATIIPVLFIVFNYLSYRFQFVDSMERDGGKKDLGTVYYPISLFILMVLSFTGYSELYIGALGVLIMGYGDGFAAVAGKRYGRYTFKVMGNTKTVEGCIAMFVFSFAIAFVILGLYSSAPIPLVAWVIAGFATIIEAISPYGLDNLTVPLLTSGFYMFFFYN
ncbi:hypothetical protein PRVXT_000700 [Proteinivorax tanatarense]|uniref:Phosphatidate cytidylyltransferase n=1 Tax=Proteinivorax tanatarense TaxID=1260629 RepID=A0AAU7VNM9_9FIRM